MDDQQLTEARVGISRLNRGAFWLIVVSVALVLVVGVGYVAWTLIQKDERSTSTIEDGIEDWADENTKGGGTITADCPDPIEWRVGETFNCIVTQGKQTVRVIVTMENDDGQVTWVAG